MPRARKLRLGLRFKKSLSRAHPVSYTHLQFRGVSRRELLKLTPVLALGAFAVPQWQGGLLKKGLGFGDWASARLFRPGHMATTFDNADLTPPPKFPINGYDVEDVYKRQDIYRHIMYEHLILDPHGSHRRKFFHF